MVIKMITRLFAVVLFILGASSGALVTTTTTSSPSTSSSDWAEHPHTDGRNGLPGAVGMVCEKSMDVIHRFAGDMLAKAIKASNMPDVPVNVGNHGTLTVKSPRIEEAVLQEFNYDMIPPNKISTRFYDGRLAANGVWQYKTNQGEMYGGTYKVQIRNFRLNATNQLFRSNDARPAIKMERCRADISELRVEARGGDPTTREGMFLTRALAIARNPDNQTMVIENCDSELCKMIITRFEQEICRIFEGFMEEVINKEMQSVPTKMCIHGDQYRVDYSLLYGEPTVNESSKCIHVGKEGKYLWRNSYGAPFNPAPMEWTNRDSMYSFRLSDFTFNTLFHQAHQSGHRFSVSDKNMDESSSNNDEDDNEDELLSMNCDESPSHPAQHARKERPTKSSTTSTTRSSTTKKSTPTSKSTTKRSTPTTRSTTTKSTPTSKSTTTKSTTSKSTPKSTSTSTSSTTSTTTTTPTSTTSTTSTSTTSKPTPAIAPAHVRKPRSTKSTTTRSTTTKSSTSSSTSKSTPSTTTKSTTTRTTSKPKSTTTRSHKPRAASMGGVNEVKCLGSLFSNSSNFGPYKGNETGDIVFKTSKPFVVYIESDERGFFDGSNGVLEFYGAKGQNGQRPFLARADVRTMRGQFTPKLNKSNITGSIKLDTLELAPSSQSSWSSNGNNNIQMTPEWLERAATFSKPMIERSINNFLRRYAQFGVPMPSKYECSSPAMNIMPRTIQMDCEVRQVQCESEPACRCFRNSCVCSEPCSSSPKRGKNAMKRNKGLRRGA